MCDVCKIKESNGPHPNIFTCKIKCSKR